MNYADAAKKIVANLEDAEHRLHLKIDEIESRR
jgi:hypothetical protein